MQIYIHIYVYMIIIVNIEMWGCKGVKVIIFSIVHLKQPSFLRDLNIKFQSLFFFSWVLKPNLITVLSGWRASKIETNPPRGGPGSYINRKPSGSQHLLGISLVKEQKPARIGFLLQSLSFKSNSVQFISLFFSFQFGPKEEVFF